MLDDMKGCRCDGGERFRDEGETLDTARGRRGPNLHLRLKRKRLSPSAHKSSCRTRQILTQLTPFSTRHRRCRHNRGVATTFLEKSGFVAHFPTPSPKWILICE